jgi:tetratricopeptide (TPR) repeat protein
LSGLTAQGWHNLGMFARAAGDLEKAQAHYEQAIHLFERLGKRREAAQARNNLGGLLLQQEHFSAAAEIFRDALAVLEKVGDRETTAQVRHNLQIALQWTSTEE